MAARAAAEAADVAEATDDIVSAAGSGKPEEVGDIPSPGRISGADLVMKAEVVVVLGG